MSAQSPSPSSPSPGDGASAAAATPAPQPQEGPDRSAAAASIPRLLRELLAYAGYWVTAEIDAARISLGRAVFATLVGAVVRLAAMAALVATAVVLLLVGCAQGLGVLLGQGPWLGSVIVGAGVLMGVLAGSLAWRRAAGKRTEQKYEAQRSRQRQEFGHDVAGRARGR
jgi:hypothetical protein